MVHQLFRGANLGKARMANLTIARDARLERADVRLVHRFAEGDPAAACDLFCQNCDPLLRFVLHRTNMSHEDAEDIVNDTFVAAMEMGRTFDGSCSVLTWLCSITRNRIVDWVRRRDAARRIPLSLLVSFDDHSQAALRQVCDPTVSMDSIVDRLDSHQLVECLLASLNPEQREALIIHYIEGFSVADGARIMGK